MTKLRISSSMASYAQQNPYQVYVEKGSEHFAELLKRISHNTIKLIMSNYYGRKDLVIDSQE
jgi:preprotein translocase subunit SecA